jgi:hypothetical protein
MTISRETVRVGAVLVVPVFVGFFAWLLLKDGDDSPEASQGVGPVEVSPIELSEWARSIRTPVYWAGEIADRKLELRRTPTGRIFVRYLPADENVATRSSQLTVATYPQGNGYEAVRAAGKRSGASKARIDGGGLLVGGTRESRSVHFSYPDADYQVEVYSPSPGQSRRLVLAGRVRPVR